MCIYVYKIEIKIIRFVQWKQYTQTSMPCFKKICWKNLPRCVNYTTNYACNLVNDITLPTCRHYQHDRRGYNSGRGEPRWDQGVCETVQDPPPLPRTHPDSGWTGPERHWGAVLQPVGYLQVSTIRDHLMCRRTLVRHTVKYSDCELSGNHTVVCSQLPGPWKTWLFPGMMKSCTSDASCVSIL